MDSGRHSAPSCLDMSLPTCTSAETRAVVSWAGPGEPIVLTLYGPEGELAVALLTERALTLAQELLTRGVQAIKVDR